MASPFPGMDPYLERHWLDVHTKLVTYAADALNERLPPDLVASTEERVAVGSGADIETRSVLGPDLRVFEPVGGNQAIAEAAITGTALAPLRLVSHSDPIIERFIKILETGTERVITVIEFVSPTNKRKRGLRAFRRKRKQLLAADVNFVEVDLVRSGDWAVLLEPHTCPPGSATPYRVAIRLPRDPDAVYLQPISLRAKLPEITIPLREGDPQVRLELQTLIDRTYLTGRYARRVDYRKPPKPVLEEGDATWADELLRAAER